MSASAATPCAVLLGHCPDRKGINAALTRFVAENEGNIVDYDQHVDAEQGVFFVRIEWELPGFRIPRERLGDAVRPLAESFGMSWQLRFSDVRPRMAVFVSKQAHCLFDILARVQSGEWRVDLPLVIANHPDLGEVVRRFGIDFQCLPVAPDTKARQERAQRELLSRHGIDLVVLARYMQILSPDFVAAFPNRIINIHHSFLPAFAGARPYHAAAERGVKIIGATSHYVTAELDTGPIIEQDIMRVSHRDSVEDLIRKGRDLETIVLARAVWFHLRNRILVYNNKTVIFD
jgi:formyltetrahydrofolate deformylase